MIRNYFSKVKGEDRQTIPDRGDGNVYCGSIKPSDNSNYNLSRAIKRLKLCLRSVEQLKKVMDDMGPPKTGNWAAIDISFHDDNLVNISNSIKKENKRIIWRYEDMQKYSTYNGQTAHHSISYDELYGAIAQITRRIK